MPRRERLTASTFPARKSGEIIEPRVNGDVIAGGEKWRLTIEGKLATSVTLKRTAQGRARKTFIRGDAAPQRVGKGARSTVPVLCALARSAKLRPLL